ncbi:unnamed protein product [Dicrocoelium dendriticum]|nr:unnamed protein product [Dicrocoelium dendriticum]
MAKGIMALFEYETPKVVQISNFKVGLAHRIIQLCIFIYVVCWVMIYEKAYQVNESAKSAVTTKIKGIAFTNYSHIPGINVRSWDVQDFITPPIENNALFVTTNMIVTTKQKLTKCAESPGVYDAFCDRDSDCAPLNIRHYGNGVNTGKCIPSNTEGSRTCEIYSWCPLENDTLPLGDYHFLFPMVENYTLLIKNDVTFDRFDVRRRNIQQWVSKRFLQTCTYDREHPEYRYCPIFKLSTIFKEAMVDKSIFVKGGLIGIDIEWDCDLDWDEKYCNPTYSFVRLDDAKAPIAAGFNFRYAHYYYLNETLHRDLIKAFGIRFLINAHGRAGKFHLLPLTMNIGSGLALLGLAPTICDIIALNLLGSKDIYQRAKFEVIQDEQELLASRKKSHAKLIADTGKHKQMSPSSAEDARSSGGPATSL